MFLTLFLQGQSTFTDTDLQESMEAVDFEGLVETAEKPTQEKTPGEKTYWEAMMLLNHPTQPDYEKGSEQLLKSADMNFTSAQNLVGISYLNGNNGFRKSKRRAADWFQLAAEQGDAYAMVNLARCYLTGTGVWRNKGKAKKWLLKAMSEEVRFPNPEPPEAYAEMVSAPSEEPQISLLANTQEEPSSYEARLNAATLLALLYAEEEDQENLYTYARFASGFDRKSTAGSYWAARTAALNLAFGIGTAKNRDEAVEILEFSKKLIRRQGMQMVHSLNQAKVLDELAIGEIEESLREETDKQNQNLEFSIAQALADQESEEWDPLEAIPWYELAAENGRAWAMLRLAFLYRDEELEIYDLQKSFEWFKKASIEGNHALGDLNLGTSYYYGIGTDVDRGKARNSWEEGSDVYYGCLSALRDGPPEGILTYEEELEMHKEAASGRDADPEALYLYGKRLMQGHGVEMDFRKAFSCFKKASRKGHAEATYAMGMDYYHGYSHSQNYQTAHELFLEAYDRGSKKAPFILGQMYTMGKGVTPDHAASAHYYQRAIEYDPADTAALNNLSVILKWRLVDNPDAGDSQTTLENMLHHWQKASELGSEDAAFNLGMLYYNGKFVEQDYQKAYFHFKDSSERGESDANYFLGLMHDQGMGMEVTRREAAYYFRLAAIGESTETKYRTYAFNRLIYYYRYGVGLERDLERALYWSTLQAKNQSALGCKRYGDLLLELGRYEDALDYFKKIRRMDNQYLQGHAFARMAEMYSEGLGVEPDFSKATKYLDKATALRSAHAIYSIARQLAAEENYTEAAIAYALSAKTSAFPMPESEKCTLFINGEEVVLGAGQASEEPDALYHLGCLYYAGKGVAKDQELAWKLFNMAARLGSSEAQMSIGIAVLKNDPAAPALEEAVELVQIAVNAGHPKADLLLQKLLDRMEQERDTEEEESIDKKTSASWWLELARI